MTKKRSAATDVGATYCMSVSVSGFLSCKQTNPHWLNYPTGTLN